MLAHVGNQQLGLLSRNRSTSVTIISPASPVHILAGEPRRAHTRHSAGEAGSSSNSCQPDEDGSALSNEFARTADPGRMRRAASHLELAWAISSARRPDRCDSCHGTTEKECEWCHGTGILMVGDTLVCSLATHGNKCAVCRGTGQCKCQRCRGTGYRATWLA